jgi:hypothetical protein
VAGAAIGVAFGWGLLVLMHLHGHVATDHVDAGPCLLVVPFPMALDHVAGLGATAILG